MHGPKNVKKKVQLYGHNVYFPRENTRARAHIHTHTHTYIYIIYIYISLTYSLSAVKCLLHFDFKELIS